MKHTACITSKHILVTKRAIIGGGQQSVLSSFMANISAGLAWSIKLQYTMIALLNELN